MLGFYLKLRQNLRWVVLIFDISASASATIFAFLLLVPGSTFNGIYTTEVKSVLLIIGVRLIFFLFGKTYAGIIRYTSTKDAFRLKSNVLFATGFLLIFNVLHRILFDVPFLPYSVLLIEFLTTSFIIVSSRLVMKIFYYEFIGSKKDRTNVVIFGDDQFAMMTQQVIEKDLNQNLNVVAFFGRRNGNKLDNIPIYKLDRLEKIIKKYDVGQLIIARANINNTVKAEIFDTCLNHNVKVLRVPDPSTWINGELSFRQLRKIQIEELLERDEIQLDEQMIKQQVTNNIIMVTGAAGSIGSEIVRQLTKYHPAQLILVDQAESPMYDLELELIEKMKFFDFKIFVADITNKEQMHKIFDLFRPSIVYHSAAYKHVPMMENNPEEAVRNNIFGTKIIADLSNLFEVNKFVMVSTDKAVNPTNIMGATKRVAEIYIQSLNTNSKTSFITTRFGNVLGSNGSVIPRFKQQIEEGGPITITHPEITRYFMTIPEACQLVLEAGAMGKGKEIFLFDMGNPVKIVDLAKKMIKLSGLTLGKDIELKFTGLRPGEKLYEELLAVQENTLPTHQSKILIARVREYNFADISLMLNELSATLKTHNYFEIVRKLKNIVPEFISKNSKYEVLDLGSSKKLTPKVFK